MPFLGETLDFLSTGWKGRPEKFVFDRVTKFSSEVFKTNIVGKPAVLLAGAAGNKFLFSNENKLVVAGLRQQDLPLHAEQLVGRRVPLDPEAPPPLPQS
ncbi:unnamed protein product [Linum tenue]|uniref:Uncharacterized protein n=1 Tax=Linum tenue TaxID=586396 RepID=A0AAV0IS08_9ROSI|nr:unnamed protein product [Linum tenue]